MSKNFLFTSESVTEGHPDKICDRISDAFLDEYLRGDPDSRVAIETMVTTNFVVVAGEVTSNTKLDQKTQEELVRKTIREIGYDNKDLKFDADTCEVTASSFPESRYQSRRYSFRFKRAGSRRSGSHVRIRHQ